MGEETFDSTYDPNNGYFPKSSVTTADAYEDPTQEPVDQGAGDPQAVRNVTEAEDKS